MNKKIIILLIAGLLSVISNAYAKSYRVWKVTFTNKANEPISVGGLTYNRGSLTPRAHCWSLPSEFDNPTKLAKGASKTFTTYDLTYFTSLCNNFWGGINFLEFDLNDNGSAMSLNSETTAGGSEEAYVRYSGYDKLQTIKSPGGVVNFNVEYFSKDKVIVTVPK